MAKYNSADIGYLLVGPYNLTDISSKLEDAVEAKIEEVSPFGTSIATYGKPGFVTYTLAGHEGWYDDDADSINAAMVGMVATENVFMFAFQGNTAAKKVICAGGALQGSYKRSFEVGAFHKASMELTISGVKDEAWMVYPLTSVSADGTTEASYIDITTPGAAGCTVYISCTALALTTRTGLVLTLRDSSDHITWADQCVMTTLTAAGAEKKVSSDMTVNRYLAAKWAFSGSGGTPTATFTMAVKVN